MGVKSRRCSLHNEVYGDKLDPTDFGLEGDVNRWCPSCLLELVNVPNACDMTGEERAIEMDILRVTPLNVPFAAIMQRISELVGRQVYVHEVALAWEDLLNEAETWEHKDFVNSVVAHLPNEEQIRAILK